MGRDMRHAKCVRPLQLHVIGNQASVSIGEGWEGDLDQVISRTAGGSRTLADELGEHLNEDNFAVSKPAKSASAKTSAPAAQQE